MRKNVRRGINGGATGILQSTVFVNGGWGVATYRFKNRPASMLVVLGLLGGCADIDLTDMGQGRAQIECQTRRDNTEYRDCMARVNKSYDDLRSQRTEGKAEK